jgi:hypothetical protein
MEFNPWNHEVSLRGNVATTLSSSLYHILELEDFGL